MGKCLNQIHQKDIKDELGAIKLPKGPMGTRE